MGSYVDGNVGCPFYRYSKKIGSTSYNIGCEAPMDGATLVLNFKTKPDQKFQLNNYCCDRYICCEIYRMLMDTKYGED